MLKSHKIVMRAFELGYRVKDNKVYSPYRDKPLKLQTDKAGYYRFSIVYKPGECRVVLVHQLMAFQKFGEVCFREDIETRHLNGDCKDNSFENIVIGTHSQNMMDRPEEDRKKDAIAAAAKRRLFSDERMAEIKRFHSGSYKKTMEKYGITSTGTLSYILNANYKTAV